MKEYTKKTCNLCGCRDIQPNMVRQVKQVHVGSSRQNIHGGTVVGLLFGNQKSKARIAKVMFANNKRGYTRNREVWMCHDCAGTSKKSSMKTGFVKIIVETVQVIAGLALWIAIGYIALHFWGGA